MTTPILITLAIVIAYALTVAVVCAFFHAAARTDTADAAWLARFDDVHGAGGGSDFDHHGSVTTSERRNDHA